MSVINVLPPKIKRARARKKQAKFNKWYEKNCGPVVVYNQNDPENKKILPK